jgi:hypothetical protein
MFALFFVVSYGNRIRPDRCNDRLVICRAGVAFSFLPLPKAGSFTITARRTEMMTNNLLFMISV